MSSSTFPVGQIAQPTTKTLHAARSQTPTIQALSNGITVVAQRTSSPTVALNIGFGVGSLNECSGQYGYAHLFEHLMFAETASLGPRAFYRYVQSLGGNVNASTSTDSTNYYSTVPPDAIEAVLALERYRFGQLINEVSLEGLRTEQGVVESERHSSNLGRPYGGAREILVSSIFGPTHPYGHVVLPDTADVHAASLSSIREFFEHTYRSAPCSIAVVGDIDPARVVDLIDRSLGDITLGGDRRAAVPPLPSPPVDPVHLHRVEEARGSRVIIGLPVPPAHTVDNEMTRLLAQLLAGGTHSLLPQRMGERGLVADVRLSFMAHQQVATLCVIDFVPLPGADLEKIVDCYFEIINTPGAALFYDLAEARGLYRWTYTNNADRAAGRAHDLVMSCLGNVPLDEADRISTRVFSAEAEQLEHLIPQFGDRSRAVVLTYRGDAS